MKPHNTTLIPAYTLTPANTNLILLLTRIKYTQAPPAKVQSALALALAAGAMCSREALGGLHRRNGGILFRIICYRV